MLVVRVALFLLSRDTAINEKEENKHPKEGRGRHARLGAGVQSESNLTGANSFFGLRTTLLTGDGTGAHWYFPFFSCRFPWCTCVSASARQSRALCRYSESREKKRKKTDNPREGWEDGTPPPHRDFKERGVMR